MKLPLQNDSYLIEIFDHSNEKMIKAGIPIGAIFVAPAMQIEMNVRNKNMMSGVKKIRHLRIVFSFPVFRRSDSIF